MPSPSSLAATPSMAASGRHDRGRMALILGDQRSDDPRRQASGRPGRAAPPGVATRPGLRLPPQAARTEGPPRTRPRRSINRAKHTTRPGRSIPPRGIQPRTVRTHGRPSMKRPAIPCHGLDPTERPARSHGRVAMTLPPAASAGTGLMRRGTRNVLSHRYATSPESSRTGYSTTKVPAQHGYWRSYGALTFASHSTTDVVGCDGLGRRLTSISAGQS